MAPDFDVLIIGSGFGGAVTACRLAEQGMKVLVLERGQSRKLSDYVTGMDELDHALRFRMMQNLAEKTPARAEFPAGFTPSCRYEGSTSW